MGTVRRRHRGRRQLTGVGRVPTKLDRAWQLGLRAIYPVLQLWWRVRRPAHRGALAALWSDGRLLVVRASYKRGWSLPGGGVDAGESAAEAAVREVREEVGLHIAVASPPTVVEGRWDGRHETVYFFEAELPAAPVLRLDHRETVEARFVAPDHLADYRFTGPVSAYLRRQGLISQRDDLNRRCRRSR